MMTVTFGGFWEMARDANFQLRGRSSEVSGVEIEMIALPRRGDRASDIGSRVERAVNWIETHGGTAELKPAGVATTIRGVVAGVRYEICSVSKKK